MSAKQSNIDAGKKTSLWKKFFSRLAILIVACLLLVSLFITFLAYNTSFRSEVISWITGIVNTQLLAKIEIDDIHLIGFGGIKLDGVRLITDGDTLANINEVIADIAIEPLLRNKLQVNKLILNDPDIKLLRRISDSSWNYNRIAAPAEIDDEAPQPVDFTIRLKDFQIRSGKFYMIDSTSSDMPLEIFNPEKMKFDNLNLNLSASINLLTNNFSAKIERISLIDRTSNIDLKHFSGNISLSPDGIKLESARIESEDWVATTQIGLTKFNVFGAIEEQDLNHTVFDIIFKVENFNPEFPKHFAPIPVDFGGKPNVEIEAKGTLNDLQVSKLNLEIEDSQIKASGLLRDVINEDVKYTFNFSGSNLRKKDLTASLPFLQNAGIPEFDMAIIKELAIDGDTRQIASIFDINSGLGNARGRATVNFEGILKYDASLSTSSLNLSKLSANNIIGLINANIKIEGSGTDLDDLQAKIDLNSFDSDLSGFHYSRLRFLGSFIAGDSLRIDTLKLVLHNPDADIGGSVFGSSVSKLLLRGAADIEDIKAPKYSFKANFDALNLKNILGNNDLPTHFSGNLALEGNGIDIDYINARLLTEFDEVLFADKAMMPFSIDAEIQTLSDSLRNFNLQSEFINAELSGKFKTSQLIETISDQGIYLAEYIDKKLNEIFPKEETDSLAQAPVFKRISFPNIDCELTADIKDISPIASFFKGMEINTSAYTKISIQTDKEQSYINIDTLDVRLFSFKAPNISLRGNRVEIEGILNLGVNDSLPDFSYLDLSIRSNRRLHFNDMFFSRPRLSLSFDGNNLDYSASTRINRTYSIEAAGKMDLASKEVSLDIDTLLLAYDSLLFWKNTKPLRFEMYDERISINQFELERENAEVLTIKGAIDNNVAQSLRITLENLPLKDLLKLMPSEEAIHIESLSGKLGVMDIKMDGSLLNPEIDFNLTADSLSFNNQSIGNLRFRSLYRNGEFKGNAGITTLGNQSRRILDININSLPIYLGIDTNIEMFSTRKPVNIGINADNLPLSIIAPFVPNVARLQGFGNAKLNIGGFLPDKIDYEGKASISNASFLLTNTNISYLARGDVSITKDRVNIDKITLRNISSDLRDGSAEVTGHVTLKDFLPHYLDISIRADRFLVLSDASARTMPNLYGNFIIGTESRPLRFYGTMLEPNLDGDVVVWNAELKMPQIVEQQVIRTSFNYEVRGDKKIYKFVSKVDSSQIVEKIDTGVDIAELINYDLSIKIKNFTILIDMGALGEVYAKIGTRDPSIPMRYVKLRNETAPKLYSGELELKEGSTVKIFRIMETKGMISFPTGAIDNPTLDLEARYDGNFIEGNTTNFYSVFVYITGTKERLNLKMDYAINNIPGTGDPKKIEEDAFFLLATGKTKSGLGSGGSNTNLVGEGLNMGISQIASKSLTDLLLGTGVIQSADVRFQGEGLETAMVNFSGSFLGIGNWTIGGNIADLSNNYEATFEIPISVNSKALNNFILQFTKATNINISTQLQDAKDFEVKIKFGGSW